MPRRNLVVFVPILDEFQYTLENDEFVEITSTDLPVEWQKDVEVSLCLVGLNVDFKSGLTYEERLGPRIQAL